MCVVCLYVCVPVLCVFVQGCVCCVHVCVYVFVCGGYVHMCACVCICVYLYMCVGACVWYVWVCMWGGAVIKKGEAHHTAASLLLGAARLAARPLPLVAPQVPAPAASPGSSRRERPQRCAHSALLSAPLSSTLPFAMSTRGGCSNLRLEELAWRVLP